MRSIIAIVVSTFLTGCAATAIAPAPVEELPVTYYDRNGDGQVDLEFHGPACCDRDWALVDQDFDGQYEKRVKWGYSLTKHVVSIPVPTDVLISPGEPPYSGWQD